MNIAQPVILKPPALRSIGRAYPPALSGGKLGKPCASFGSNQALPWNPFSWFFGKVNQAFTSFSETRVGQWLGTWLKKINNFLQAPKKEPSKADSPAPAPSPKPVSLIDSQNTPQILPDAESPKIVEPPAPLTTTSPTQGETPLQPPQQQVKPKATSKLITPHEKLMAESKRLLAAHKRKKYLTLSKEALLEKLSAFKQACQLCQSQQRRLSKELKSLQSLKRNQIQLLRPASSNYKKLKDELASTSQGGNGKPLSSEAEKKLKFKLKAQKGLILELEAGLRLLETKIQAHSTAFKETNHQFDKIKREIQKLEPCLVIQTGLGKIQPLTTELG